MHIGSNECQECWKLNQNLNSQHAADLFLFEPKFGSISKKTYNLYLYNRFSPIICSSHHPLLLWTFNIQLYSYRSNSLIQKYLNLVHILVQKSAFGSNLHDHVCVPEAHCAPTCLQYALWTLNLQSGALRVRPTLALH